MTAVGGIRRWIEKRDLKGCDAAEQLLQLAYLMDCLVKEDNPNLINRRSTEIIAWKMYSVQLAYGPVKEQSHWERPKSLHKATKWESEVLADLAREYTINPEDEEDVAPIEAADAKTRKALRDRALLIRALGALDSGSP